MNAKYYTAPEKIPGIFWKGFDYVNFHVHKKSKSIHVSMAFVKYTHGHMYVEPFLKRRLSVMIKDRFLDTLKWFNHGNEYIQGSYIEGYFSLSHAKASSTGPAIIYNCNETFSMPTTNYNNK